MLKYKILIVDDEADVREGIVGRMDWDGLGFEIIAEADNGNDALEKMEAKEVDVVLTDIKMPFMDGLTMCGKLAALYPDIKIIILSGFDEFEYAKAAIRLNVVEYVLKPVNVSELSEILRRVRRQLDKSIEQKRNIDSLRESYLKTLPLMREHFLNELLWGTVAGEELAAQLERYDLPINKDLYKVVAVFEVAPKSSPLIDRELVPVSVKQLVEEQLENNCKCVVFCGSSFVIAITAWSKPNPIGMLMNIANDICLSCIRVFELSVTAGIGRCYESCDDIHYSFLEARSALEYKVIEGDGRAIYIYDMERVGGKTQEQNNRESDRLLSTIKFGTSEQLDRFIADIFARMDKLGDMERQISLLSIFNTICRIVERHDLRGEPAIAKRLEQFLRAPGEWADRRAMSRWALDICACIGEFISTKRETATRNLTEEAKRFIEEHYRESGLSVERLCEHLHVSQSYFSSVFKKETGTSYVQYLTDIRMARAAEFLRETDEKTYEIACKVGYEEPNYFSYVFKRHYGVSPTKYRK